MYKRRKSGTSWGGWVQFATTSDNVASATKLKTSRTISLTGDVTGSASFDGSANASITATVADDSHNHTSLKTLGSQSPETGRTASRGGLYSYGTDTTTTGAATTYTSVIGFGKGAAGHGEIAVGWLTSGGMWYRSLRDMSDDWIDWVRVYDTKNKPTYSDVGAPSTTGTNASGTWGISVTGNAATATTLATARTFQIADNDGTNKGPTASFNGSANVVLNLPSSIKANASTASQLNAYSTPGEYTKNTLAYFNSSLNHSGTAQKGINDGPTTTNTWWHFLRFTHSNGAGYYTDLAVPFNDNSLYYKRIANGSVQNASTNAGWVQVLDALNYTTYCAPASHSHSYVPLSGGTMTGKLQVNDLIVGYNYTKNGNNIASFVWDKPGSNWTGMGANSEQDTIYFGACDADGIWNTSYRQKWKFNGSLIVGGGDDNCNIVPWTNNYSTIGTESLKWWKIYATNIYGNTVYGAVWNDYAEYRETTSYIRPGCVVYENGDDTLSLANERMIPACQLVSDTFGFAIGETDKCKTPLAVSGRALAYPYEDRNSYKPGDAVCSGPNGTVSKMTQEEKVNHPECIIGYVSCIPTYETWGTGNVAVNGRIWIKVV